MKKKYIHYLIFAIVVTTISCKLLATPPEGENTSDPIENTPVRNDSEGLAQIINLPARPQSALWHVSTPGNENPRSVPGPSDYTLEAVITFSDEDFQAIQADASAYVLDWIVEWDESYFEEWYPDSIKNSFTFDDETGKYRLVHSVYDASQMFGKSPYLTGSFIFSDVNAGELFLSLSSN